MDYLSNESVIHVLPQEAWHDPAAIVGNRKGLEMLRDAIDASLQGVGQTVQTFARDGEGYHIVIACRENMNDVPFGYTGVDGMCPNEDVFWPDWLINILKTASSEEEG